MNKELKKKWVEALRSGKYQQGTNYLKQRGESGVIRHCCLGVLCEIMPPRPDVSIGEAQIEIESKFESGGEQIDAKSTTNLSTKLAVDLGLEEYDLELISLNDNRQASFAKIARYIEDVIPED